MGDQGASGHRVDEREVLRWVDEGLAACGVRRTGGPGEPRVRPWSYVLSAPTAAGRVWFKAGATCTSYEPGLLSVLRTVAPGALLEPYRLDVPRGWSLLPDGGRTLREELAGDATEAVRRWPVILAGHAALQRRSADVVDQLVTVGVPDQRPELIGQVAERLIAGVSDAALRERVGRWRETRLAEAAARLAGSPVPLGVDHDDLHDGNVTVAGGYRFLDWGDACVTHPFAVLLVLRRMLAHQYGWAADGPEIARIVDSYLECFSDLASLPELREDARAAEQLGIVCRAASWDRALTTTSGPTEWGDAATEWLAEAVTTYAQPR